MMVAKPSHKTPHQINRPATSSNHESIVVTGEADLGSENRSSAVDAGDNPTPSAIRTIRHCTAARLPVLVMGSHAPRGFAGPRESRRDGLGKDGRTKPGTRITSRPDANSRTGPGRRYRLD